MTKAKAKLKEAWEENPLLVIGIATAAGTVAVKLMQSYAAVQNSHAWKREVARRERKTRP